MHASYHLRFESGKRQGERVLLEQGSLSIGTGRQNGLVLRDAGVSFKHATLHRHGDALELEPAESRGGSWIGEQRLAPGRRVALAPGDPFRLGEVRLRVVVPPPPRLIELELCFRVSRGRRAGDQVVVSPGSIRVGSARQAEISLREAGVSFKHAELRLDALGLGQVEDLGGREGTWLNGQRLERRTPYPFRPFDALRIGPEIELQLTPRLSARTEAPLREAISLPDEALPPELLELALEPVRGTPLPLALEQLPDDGERLDLERDARQLLIELQGLVQPEHLPPQPALWLRLELAGSELSLYHEDERGLALAWRRWEVVCRLPDPAPGLEAGMVGNALSRLLPGAERLVAAESESAGGPWWRCRYESDRAILNAFERLDVWSDGRMLLAAMRPHFAIRPLEPERGEDPIAELLKQQEARRLWRPPPQGVGPAAPSLPAGGREGRRPLPKRKR